MLITEGMSNLQLDVIDPLTGMAELRWSSTLVGVLYQAYVNGEWAAATEDESDPWRLQLPLPIGQQAMIELVAVGPGEGQTDFAAQLTGFAAADANRCRFRWPRLATVHSPGDAIVIAWDSGGGQIDEDAPLATLPLWLDGVGRWGRGAGPRGEGGRGYDGAAAPGRGVGARGWGERGFDATLGEWQSGPLPAGEYRFSLRVADPAGNLSDAKEETIALDPPPRSAGGLSIEYDKSSDTVSLEWSASPDLN